MEDFLRWALPRLGYRYEGFRRIRRRVVRRLERHCRALGLPGLAAYRRRLEGASGDWEELDRLLNVTISKFYRDRALLGEGRLLEKKGDKAKAIERYKELIAKHATSSLREDAQNRLAALESP